MKRILVTIPLAALALACGGAAPEPPSSAADARDGADRPLEARTLAAKLVGRWSMAPPPGDRRLVALARFALAEPPDEAGFAATAPTPEEQQHFANVVRLRREEPASPLLAELRRKLDRLDAVRVSFTGSELIATTDAGTSVTHYRVEKELDSELVMLEDGEGPPEARRSIIDFVDDDNVVVTRGPTRVPMTRVRDGQAARPTEAPSRASPAAAVPAGATEAPSRASPAAAVPAGGGELEACERSYFACVDAMPPEAREAMGPSLELVKVRFAQAKRGEADAASVTEACKSVVRLIRSAGYCG